MIPVGSELKGVMLPRYDQAQRLVGVMKAKAMTLITDQTIAGETISIEFFNPDRSPRGRVDLVKATFNQAKGTLDAREPVTIQSDRFSAKGTGLVYAFEPGEGFLLGPATTWIQNPIETTMHSSPSPLRAAAIGATLLTQSLAAAPPPPVSEGEMTALHADAAPKADDHAAAAKAARTNLGRDLDASNAANAAARAFLETTELTPAKSAGEAPVVAAAKPLDLQPGPQDTVILCDGGMYFDADEGVFVYLKNVRVNDPRFSLTGANELKVFLGKEPADPAKKPDNKDKTSLGFSGKFGDVERIVATGAVVIDQKPAPGKDPVKASGAIFSYNIKTDQVIITGGYPWFIPQKGICLRAKQPDLIVHLSPKAGTAVAGPGEWETILSTEQLQKKK